MVDPIREFWMVIRVPEGGGMHSPKIRHQKFGEALTEAIRLAKKDSVAFAVLSVVKVVVPIVSVMIENPILRIGSKDVDIVGGAA